MYIGGTEFSLKRRTYEIYVSGCTRRCEGCHNPQLWDFEVGEKVDDNYINKLINTINDATNLIDNIFIVGGEPLEQPIDELIYLLKKLKITNKKIWLFTHYDNLSLIPKELFNYIDYIKCGEFIKDSTSIVYYGIELASTNQIIYKVSDLNII
jgi:anaerobic ribonucleoside-triphosphate reductase activating protein